MKGKIIQQTKGWLIPVLVIVGFLTVVPIVGIPDSWVLYFFLFFVYLAMANMWNLLAGYAGLVSLCQPAFIGLAGYTLVICTWSGLSFYIGILAGAVVAAIFALLISIPVFRLSGMYFSIGTLVIPEALRIFFFLWRPVGGEMHGGGAGYMVKGVGGVSMAVFYWLALFVGLISVFVMRLILRSKLGMGLASIRDNERAAASCGIDVFRLKLHSFIISAFITGLAGGVFYIYQGYIEPASAFNIRWTMIVMLATVIGGMSTEEGPIIGTAVVVFLHFLLARYAGLSLLIQGIILVTLMLLTPRGIMGFVWKRETFKSLMQLVGRS